jgi:APA family basic amino acid/polyamine antiporter
MLPHGWVGFFSAVALVSFATNGAQFIAEIGGEMKYPGRDIPLAMYTATTGVGLLYGIIATVACGVLPVAQVADKPLTNVAKAIMPAPLFLFFMVGGALVVLIIHLLVIFATVTKGLMIACQDGWLPKRLGAVNRRFGTPHWLLTMMFVVGITPVLSGMTITTIAALGSGVGFFTYLIPFIACTQLPKKFPEAYAKAKFKLKPITINIVVSVAIVLSVGQGILLLMKLKPALRISVVVYITVCALYVYLVGKTSSYQAIRASKGFHPDEEAGKTLAKETVEVTQS